MKKKLMIVLMLLATIFAKAQTSVYHPFPESNAIWNIKCGVWPCYNSNSWNEYFSYTILGDTVINTITYHKWYIPEVVYADNCDSINFAGYIGAFRNDIPNKKVYYIHSGSNTEEVLYDFNITVGDTINKSWGFKQPYVMVVSVEDSVRVGENYRKIWHASSISAGSVDIIEGIGGTRGPIKYWDVIDPPTYNLICFSQNGNINYPGDSPCNIISLINSNDAEMSATLSPNPFHFSSQLTLSKTFSNAELKIYNTNGDQVRQQRISSQTTTIYRDGLSDGVYLFQINNSKGKTASGKLVIE
jgi:hypothetical protein